MNEWMNEKKISKLTNEKMYWVRQYKKEQNEWSDRKMVDWMNEYIKQQRQIQKKVWKNERFS